MPKRYNCNAYNLFQLHTIASFLSRLRFLSPFLVSFFLMDNTNLAIHFFLQIAVILVACRIVGAIAAKLGQPQVVAEMITGVLLGPSLFGLLLPDIQNSLFPWDSTQQTRDTSAYLFPASQLGLALYMFIVGLEFRGDILKEQFKSSLAVSVAGMVAPFVFGMGLAWILFHHTSLFPEKTSLHEAMLFLGASMCVTAFPMLARIIHFKGLVGTTMGTVSLGAGAIGDVVAWIMLAVVLASFDGDLGRSVYNIGGAIGFMIFAFYVVRPILLRFPRILLRKDGTLGSGGITVGLALMALGAWFTDSIHLHAVFGTFMMGAAMPRGVFNKEFIQRTQPLTVALLLPLFFAYSGLNTQIGLLNSWSLWGACAAVLLAAMLGKWVACTIAARATGLNHRDAMGVGILMNARGLMELIIINIGLQRGVITKGLFATLVIMAIITTLMASPLFEIFVAHRGEEIEGAGPVGSEDSA